MHTVDIVALCAAVLVVVGFAAVLARQRYMLRLTGAVPLAVLRGQRWLYGIGRYTGGQLRWYRALGVGTSPSLVLRQGSVEVVARRKRRPEEKGSLPGGVVVVELRQQTGSIVTLAFGESAYTGFVSWLESAAPRA